jgi:hypothetical protein
MKAKVTLILLTACGLQAAWAAEPAQLQGLEGYWLTNGVAEAFISAKPHTRIAVFRLKGGENPMRVSSTDIYCGVRLWYMEPLQTDCSGLPATQSAQAEVLGPLTLRLTAAPEDKSGLQAILEVTLDAKAPVLRARHGLKNLRPSTRRMAAWALIAFPNQGLAFVPWRGEAGAMRSLLLFMNGDPTEPCLHIGQRALGVDFRVMPRSGQIKVGSNSDAGWAAYVRNGLVLKSSVAFCKDGDYSEGGSTVTFYHCGLPDQDGFGELENMGPLRDVAPGAILWMDQSLELVSGLKPSGPRTDDALAALESRSSGAGLPDK